MQLWFLIKLKSLKENTGKERFCSCHNLEKSASGDTSYSKIVAEELRMYGRTLLQAIGINELFKKP